MGLFDSMADGLFGESDAAGKANEYLNQIPGEMGKYLNPSFDRGERAGKSLEGKYGSMMDNPQDFINAIMQGYQSSQGYQQKQDAMGTSAANTAAAGGQRGSALDQQRQQQITQSLLGNDQQDWLKNVLGVQNRGMQGEEGMMTLGQQAGTNMAESMANVLGTKGQLAFQGEREHSKRGQDLLGSLTKLAGAFAGMPTGGFGMSGTDSFYGGS